MTSIKNRKIRKELHYEETINDVFGSKSIDYDNLKLQFVQESGHKFNGKLRFG